MTNLWPMIRLEVRALAAGSPRLLVVIIFAAVVFGMLGGVGMAAPMGGALALMLSLQVFSYDSTHKLTHLHATLPVDRRAVITAHYLAAFIVIAGIIALVSVGATVGALYRGDPIGEGWGASLTLFAMLSLAAAVIIPLQVRFGQKALLIGILLVFGATFLALAGVGFLGDEVVTRWVAAFGELSARWWAWVAPIVVLVAWFVSYLVARRTYLRQDH